MTDAVHLCRLVRMDASSPRHRLRAAGPWHRALTVLIAVALLFSGAGHEALHAIERSAAADRSHVCGCDHDQEREAPSPGGCEHSDSDGCHTCPLCHLVGTHPQAPGGPLPPIAPAGSAVAAAANAHHAAVEAGRDAPRGPPSA